MLATSAEDVATSTLPVEAAPPAPPSFDDLGLHPDVKQALDDMGYFAPTPVQTAVFGPVSERKDLMVQSRTGTGKTAAFGLPLINRLVPAHRQPQAMILAPTRELALQVAKELTQLGKHRGIVIEPIYGGAPIGKQIANLKNGVHIIVGTPGRVLDLIGRRALDTKTIDTFVLDECDEMLSMGFLPDIEEVVKHLPEKLQTLLFSATMPDEVMRYARRHMKTPENLSLSRDGATIKDIHHAYYIVSGIARGRDLLKVIYSEEPESAIIFCNMRDETTMVAKYLQKQGLDAEPLSSDLSQADRERVMTRMKQKNLRFLCATDVAARGIDISNLSHVINFMVPMSPEIYVHRTGRTGRAGKKGVAISLVGPRELGNFRYVRLQFDLKPEERVLPSDDVFVGKLKHPLPPVGLPKPPDATQILTRGVTGTPTELERQLFEKLLASQAGKRVLAQLVAEKLNELTTHNKPRARRVEHTERHDEGTAPAAAAPAPSEHAGGDRPERSFDRDRGDRGGDRGERGGDRGDRPRFGGGDRDRGGRGGDRGDRPRFGGGGDRDRGDRGGRDRDRGDRPRFGGGDRPERSENRDRPEHREGDAAAPVATDVVTSAAPVETAAPQPQHESRPPREHGGGGDDRREYRGGRDRNDRNDRGGDRERGGRDRHEARRDRDGRDQRDNRPPRDAEPVATDVTPAIEPTAPVFAAPHHVETAAPIEAPTKVEDVARAAIERADRGRDRDKPHRGGDKKRGGGEPGETKEFWETWAAEKTTREPAPVAVTEAVAEAAVEAVEADGDDEPKKGGRGRDRGGRGKGRDDKKPAKADAAKKADKPAKADDKKAAPAAIVTGADAKLFVSLGKKHGVTADDLRALLAGPVGGDKARIGSVMLRDSHAHVKVTEGDVDTIIGALHGTKHDKHDVTVERARA